MWPWIGALAMVWWIAAQGERRRRLALRNPRRPRGIARRNPRAAPPVVAAQRAYRAFHGVDAPPGRLLALPAHPAALWRIGRALRIDYQVEGPSRKAGTEYTHEWGDTGYGMRRERPLLAADAHGNLYVLRDRSRYRVNGRGIVG